MSSTKRPQLKPNPFISLRDPKTGKWRVIFNFSQGTFVQNTFSAEGFSSDKPLPDS